MKNELHGHTVNGWSREYRSYHSMKNRCNNKYAGSYSRYGAIGIKVCDRWAHSFVAFLIDVGYAPSNKHQLDRIDPTKNYEPGNVRWVTARENNESRRNRHWVTLDGERILLSHACERYGNELRTVEARIKNGWPIDQAVKEKNYGFNASKDPIIRALQLAARSIGADWSVIRKRLRRGWTVSNAFHGAPEKESVRKARVAACAGASE